MITKKFLVKVLVFSISLPASGQDGVIGKIDDSDTVKSKIDSITTFILHPDSKFAYAEEHDPSSPNGLYAIYRADTTKGELRKVIYYEYQKKISKLLNFYYYNNKLIKVTEYRSRRRRVHDDVPTKYERTTYYWNDTLYYSYNPMGDEFDNHLDLEIGQRLLRRFQNKYTQRQLNFNRL